MTQREALEILKTGRNAFITGPAGSGKTYVVNEYIRYLRDHDVAIGITASTGIAATHMGGMTIHSWSGIGVRDYLAEHDIAAIAEKANLKKRIEAVKVLIIDEVSMLHHFRLDLVERVVRYIKKNEAPFGGLQVVLCGDFFQLPPVSRLGEQQAHFIYESDAWKVGKFAVCYLSEQHRQSESDASTSILNEIRSGEVSDETRELLKGRYRSDIAHLEPTRLFTHNIDVDSVNEKELAKVGETEFRYEMTSRGKKPLVEALKKSCLAPEVLRLKKGARIMCVKNNYDKGYVNGTLGIVVSCGPGVDPVIRTGASPDFPEGRLLTIEPATWNIEEDGKVLAEISQYPLRLAWAITVHKSQGMSLDAAEVDLSRCFEPGMGYVALSRVRSLGGLSILGMNENALRVHPEVLEYDSHLKSLSMKGERWLASTDSNEVTKQHEAYLAKVGPLHSMGSKKQKGSKGGRKGGINGGFTSKVPKLSTYEQTALLIDERMTLKAMAKERGMNEETIVSHIETLLGEGHKPDVAYLKGEISNAHWQKLEKALDEVSIAQSEKGDDRPPLLSPVKSKVGFNISFKEIRLARVLLGYVRKTPRGE